MQDEDLQPLLRSLLESQNALTESQNALTEAQNALTEAQKETDQQLKETAQQLKETDQQLKESIKEADRRQQEADRRQQETDRQLKEQSERTDQQLKELGRQIGGLGNKFGGFTEGLALPSMTRILQQRFGVETMTPRVRSRQGAELLEMDVLGYANGPVNSAYVVEVKSRFRERDLAQVLETLERFPQFFPEHADKRLYGIVATVDMPERERLSVLDAGLYLAVIEDELFELQTPPGFKAQDFNAPIPVLSC